MKTNSNIIRILAGLSFLIFFCPFFQTCSDKNLETAFVKVPSNWESFTKEQKMDYKRSHFTENAYQLAYSYSEALVENRMDIHEKETLKDPIFYTIILFLAALLLSVAIFIASLFKKHKTVFILSCVNMILLIAETIFIFLPGSLIEHILQIKFGYYLFIINTIAILILSYKTSRRKQDYAI